MKELLCALCLALVGCAGVAPRPQILFASDSANPPFASLDEAGRPVGMEVDLIAGIARRIDSEILWRQMPFDELLDAVAAGSIDGACATIGITPERAAQVAFSRPYFLTEIVAVVRTEPGSPTGLDELAGHRVAGGRGTTSERAIQRRLPHSVFDFESASDAAATDRLLARELDAVVMDRPAAERIVADSGGQLAVLPEALETEAYAVAVAPAKAGLLEKVDRALNQMEASGELAELAARWGLAPLGE